ncbi:protein yippee-like 2 isoform X2 [Bos indicus]|uniref:Protein yippee-like 2 isoform X2 n=1 Tax=Bos indicus TaxID=9915 RepID=A0ABM4QZF1_BOSIN
MRSGGGGGCGFKSAPGARDPAGRSFAAAHPRGAYRGAGRTGLLAACLSQHQGLFQRVSSSHQVAKDWSFSITSPNEFDLLAVQGTLKSLLQYHTLKAVLQRSAFFMIQLSASIRDYWKNHTLLQLKVDALGQPWESEDVLRELDIFCVVIN